jgi:hypothetical protein
MSSGFDSGERSRGKPGHATLTAPGERATPEPGKSTLTGGALPRTTGEAGALGPAGEPSYAAGPAERYSDMLAVMLAAKSLTDRAKPDDPEAHAQILKLIEPVERRLGELNDHQGRLAQFGAGNIAGQAALDMAEAAVRSWRQLLTLGAMVRTEELVLRFRAGAEVIQFLTGEQRDAPTLREFDHVSGLVGKGAAAIVLAPALVGAVAAEAPMLAFAGEVAARRVALWALMHPAAALAASEGLLGFGIQIGEDGWENFWAQLQDPQGRWFILAQVLMDYMHVRGGMGGHGEPTSPRRGAQVGGDPVPDVDGVQHHLAKARAALQRVHDAVEAEPSQAAAGGRAARDHDETPEHDGAPVATSAVKPAAREITYEEATADLIAEIERNAGGQRRPALELIEPAEMARLRQEFADLGGDPEILRFNKGAQTSFVDDVDRINVRGDINSVEGARHPRSAMSSRAVLGHELGHRAHRGTKLPVGAWNDEFRASYWAARNLPTLSDEDRIHLVMDAMERAREAHVPVKANAFMRRILYGY